MIVRDIIEVEILNDNFDKVGCKSINEFNSEDIQDDLIYAISCTLNKSDIKWLKYSDEYDKTKTYKKIFIYKRYNEKVFGDVLIAEIDADLILFKDRFNKKMSRTIKKLSEVE